VQQANVQGITVVVSSGDAGAAGCDTAFASSSATNGEAVEFPAGVPDVTAVGGTEFNEGNGNYWSSTNSSTLASALSYIPETAWNESLLENELAASGGGISSIYPQPSWQVGPGLQTWGARAVPDVALDAANDHDPYVIVTGGQAGFYGGTSAAAPVFAGIIALVNQYEHSGGQGNINPNLYRLAQTNIFHDITTGNNIVPCVSGTPDCSTGSFGYSAGIGYDPVTGLGSVDAYNLVTGWNAPTPISQVLASCNPNPVYEQSPDSEGYSWTFTLSLQEAAGVATSLTEFTLNGASYASQIASFFGTFTIPANGTISATLGFKTLTVPTTEVFVFSGVDAGGRQWSQQLSVPFNTTQSSPPPTIALSKTQLQFSWAIGGAIPPSQSVNVSNSGGGTFTWTASSNVSWLSLSSATGLLTIGVSPTGLAPGNYTGTVSVNAAGVANSSPIDKRSSRSGGGYSYHGGL
jgi:subtilase family serine protease